MIRVRFAPSPTGSLHLGGLRTALFNYLFAKKNEGTLILRLEDTDKNRNVPDAAWKLTRTLNKMGIYFDESPTLDGGNGPYVQSQRLPLYQEYSRQLLETGNAYRCFCTKERLKALAKLPGGYDGHCRMLPNSAIQDKIHKDLPFTIRFKMHQGVTEVQDEVYGVVEFQNAVLSDQILLKSDGYPTYHFANVVDDHFMRISHVIRGEEWLSSTPTHVRLYKAFGWTPPVFVHLPLLLSKEGEGKLSKRDASASVDSYLEKGFLPASLLNFVALLGWAPPNGQEIMTLSQMIGTFSFSHINKASAKVDVDRLKWINKHHFERMLNLSNDLKLFVNEISDKVVQEYGDRLELREKLLQENYIESVVKLVKERSQLMPEMVKEMKYFFIDPELQLSLDCNDSALQEMYKSFVAVEEWVEPEIGRAIEQLCRGQSKFERRKVMRTLRLLLTGLEVGPPITSIMQTLGKDVVCERIKSQH